MSTLDDLLSAAGRVDEITSGGLRRGRGSLEAAIAAPRTRGAAAPRRAARLGPLRAIALTGAVAAACAAAITIPAFTGGGHSGADASAATLLRAAGSAAGSQPGGWPDAAYWHVTSLYKRSGATIYHRQIWVAHHGQSVLRDTSLGGSVISLGTGEFPAGNAALTWDQLYALPTDPGQLGAALRADIKGAGQDPATELFAIVGDLLRESPASPALREALYDVAAGIPGVHITGKVTDELGRTGTGVERDGETLVIDPRSGALLAEVETGFSATYVSQGPATVAPAAASRTDTIAPTTSR
jgi:hypothetical protein